MVPAGTSAMSPVIARSAARSVALNTQNSHKANKHRPVSVSFRFDLVTFSKASNVYRNVKNLMYHELYYFADINNGPVSGSLPLIVLCALKICLLYVGRHLYQNGVKNISH